MISIGGRMRDGDLKVGDAAPDFSLPGRDRASTVTLSGFRHAKPVVLIFGSFT
jgi:peroxiredoxin